MCGDSPLIPAGASPLIPDVGVYASSSLTIRLARGLVTSLISKDKLWVLGAPTLFWGDLVDFCSDSVYCPPLTRFDFAPPFLVCGGGGR